MTALAKTSGNGVDAAMLERVIVHGDLSKLSPREKGSYYIKVCESVGINPLTKPFEYLRLNGKDVLYATRTCTDQLRQIHGVSVTITGRDKMGDVYVVTATATDKHGRRDESTGAVTIGNAKGDALCNALMKAETKAKRRVTLSICGLGWLDETEIETIPANRRGPAPALDDGSGATPEPSEEAKTLANQVEQLGTQADYETFCELEGWHLKRMPMEDNAHVWDALKRHKPKSITVQQLREWMDAAPAPRAIDVHAEPDPATDGDTGEQGEWVRDEDDEGPDWVMPFGKHKGERLGDVPGGYLEFLCNKAQTGLDNGTSRDADRDRDMVARFERELSRRAHFAEAKSLDEMADDIPY